jgi:hypothetical protein
MHLLIPYAAPWSEAGRQAQRTLRLPHLAALLKRLQPLPADPIDTGNEWSLSPPHERALARALGLQGADGAVPWAAWLARADGIDPGDLAWGLVTPAHWHLGTDQVSMLDPEALLLDAAGSRALFDAVHGLFSSQGWLLHWGAPLRWYAAHESLAELPCASLDRVIGRNVDRWLGDAPAARRLRRLQAEFQMLLYTHPLNDERVARGLAPVNSFWLSGCGVAQMTTGTLPTVDLRLRKPALAEDWAAWVKAWDTLDEGPVAEAEARARRGEAVVLTLCGERLAQRFEGTTSGWLQGLRQRWSTPALSPLLEAL